MKVVKSKVKQESIGVARIPYIKDWGKNYEEEEGAGEGEKLEGWKDEKGEETGE